MLQSLEMNIYITIDEKVRLFGRLERGECYRIRNAHNRSYSILWPSHQSGGARREGEDEPSSFGGSGFIGTCTPRTILPLPFTSILCSPALPNSTADVTRPESIDIGSGMGSGLDGRGARESGIGVQRLLMRTKWERPGRGRVEGAARKCGKVLFINFWGEESRVRSWRR